jgi:hypothetical protein
LQYPTFNPTRWVAAAVLLALGLSLLPFGPAYSQAVRLTIEAEPALGGYFKYGEWLPVWVTLENNGPDVQAEVQVRLSDGGGATTFAAPADLPTGSRKRVPVYILPNSFSHELEVQLVEGNNLLASRKINVQPQPNINYLIGVVTPERGALSLLQTISIGSTQRPIILIDLELEDLPERVEGLRSLNTLVINAVDTSNLSTGQQVALQSWVQQGGRLVVGGGAEASRAVAGLPESLLPFAPSGLEEVAEIDALGDFAGGESVRVPGPFTVATGEARAGRSLLDQDRLPLIQEQAVDRGYVDFIALDLAQAPFDAWSGTGAFWEALLSPGADYPEWLPYDMSLRQNRSSSMPYALSNLPALELPSIRSLALLLALYVLVVGPVNYLVLRWRKRLHLAWVTTPLFTLVFSAGAFGLGYALHGTDLILNKIAIVEVQPSGNASVSSYLGLFSPTQQSYEIEVSGGGLLSPLRIEGDPFASGGIGQSADMLFLQGEPSQVRGLTVNQWSMQSFMAELTWKGFGQLAGDLQLEGGDGTAAIKGTVRNETAYTLEDAVLVIGSQFTRLGDLAPGQEKLVDMSLPTLLGQPFEPSISWKLFQEELERPSPSGPPRDIQLKQTVLDNIFPWGSWYGPIMGANTSITSPTSTSRLLLLAWLDQAPPEPRIADRSPVEQTTALVMAALPYHLPQGGVLSLPPGFLQGTVLELNDGGFCGPMGVPAVYLGRQESIFEFQVPSGSEPGSPIEGEQLQIEQLVIHIGSDTGTNQVPDTGIFNWESETWSDLQGPVSGKNVIAEVDGLISADGKVRVRLVPNNFFGGGCFFLALGLEGTRR